MHAEILEILRCPRTGQRLQLQDAQYDGDRVRSGLLVTKCGENRYPVRDFVPCFVPENNYADNFGMQWNLFRQTQLDSYSGRSISADRFWKATGWKAIELSGKWVLDCGCGAGRFAEVALNVGATVVALDYSIATNACYMNLRHNRNLHVVRADLYALPFVRDFFPFVYSLGVLQHTPDVAKAFAALPPMVAKGGRLCVDFYERSWKSSLLPKYWLRPFTKKMPKEKLFKRLQYWVPKLLPLSVALGGIPAAGTYLRRLVPVANYKKILPLSDEQLNEWALLDTFDMLAPEFDNPQTRKTILQWMQQAGLEGIEVLKAGHLVGRGRKP